MLKLKALSVSEFIKLDDEKQYEYLENLCKIINIKQYGGIYFGNAKVLIYNDFLSQPFQPEMITRLFKGFSKVYNDDRQVYRIRNLRINFGYKEYETVHLSGISKAGNFMKVRDLHDFINDCDRAKIDLFWNF